MTDTQYKASIGTISHGTLRAEDLIDSFLDELNRLASAKADSILADYEDYEAACEDEDHDFWTNDADEMVNALQDALNEYAPPFCYFGATEGDGSDFGFWPSLDNIDEDGDVVKVESVPSYILQVNDHGNATLYEVSVKEVWSII